MIEYLAEQLRVSAAALEEYGAPGHHTRHDHSQQAIAHLSFRRTGGEDLRKLRDWLVARARTRSAGAAGRARVQATPGR